MKDDDGGDESSAEEPLEDYAIEGYHPCHAQ